jgi:hypothetical protein
MGHGTKIGKKRSNERRSREVEQEKGEGRMADHTVPIKKDGEIY